MIFGVVMVLGSLLLFLTCSPPKPEPVRTGTIPDGEIDPAKWGQVYPLEYDSWKKTADPKPLTSKYKNAHTATGPHVDKLSEFPYMALLFHGWGFGIEYNEPRGHHYMLIDQLEIDPSRLKSGGACLTCKTPFAPKLEKEMGVKYFSDPYMDVHAKIPVQFQRLGVSCADCHNNKTLDLQFSRWTLDQALKDIGKSSEQTSRQDKRSLVCAQCHVTYIVKKDKDMKSIAVFFPWQGSKEGDISIENIIKVLKSDPANLEWTQKVTGFKVGFIRHPEYEFYSRDSVHWKAGVSCADCHMPYIKVGANKISDHDVTSPLKKNFQACQQCHTETPEWLRKQVIAIQDRTVSLMLRAGYQTAVAAKLFELAHQAQQQGKPIDRKLYDEAKDLYLEALYRNIFVGAENSVGFHNPSEAGRILGDAIAMAGRSEALLRQALTQAGVAVPLQVNLELAKYLNNRGVKPLNFQLKEEFKDPFGIQDRLTPPASLGLTAPVAQAPSSAAPKK
ncbi:MAG: ammonia-forming cytochrome c nitrite reductase subunit c552 [Thermodesulfobacteriota bacterium]